MARSRSAPVSTDALLARLGERLARERLRRNRTQTELAQEAGVSRATIVRLEGGESTQLANLVKVLGALGLERNLDALVPVPAVSPLERAEREGRERKRASSRPPKPSERAWTWGEDR